MRTLAFRLILPLLFVAVALPAMAAPITFRFTGTITSAFSGGPDGPPDGVVVEVGDSITGEYSFESTAADISPDPDFGDYTGSILSASFAFGNSTLQGDATGAPINHIDVDVANDPSGTPGSYFVEIDTTSGGILNGAPLELWHFDFWFESSTEPLSDAIPLTPPDLATWTPGGNTLLIANFTEGKDLFLGWSWETFTAVPEPSTGLLLAAAVLSCAGRSHRDSAT